MGAGLHPAQLFIDREHAGYFIELIERSENAPAGSFINDNLSRLAATMSSYVEEEAEAAPALAIAISVPAEQVLAVLAAPDKLPLWTCHRSLRRSADRFIAVRLHGDVEVTAARDPTGVTYQFARAGKVVSTRLTVVPQADSSCIVSAELPARPLAILRHIGKGVAAELHLLRALLLGTAYGSELSAKEALTLEHSQTVYARKELCSQAAPAPRAALVSL